MYSDNFCDMILKITISDSLLDLDFGIICYKDTLTQQKKPKINNSYKSYFCSVCGWV
jgi:hypothetical protein